MMDDDARATLESQHNSRDFLFRVGLNVLSCLRSLSATQLGLRLETASHNLGCVTVIVTVLI